MLNKSEGLFSVTEKTQSIVNIALYYDTKNLCKFYILWNEITKMLKVYQSYNLLWYFCDVKSVRAMSLQSKYNQI